MAAALLAVAGESPAWGSHDGPPVIGEEGPSVPQIHRPAGGGAVRIYGEGLLGTTAVTVGGVSAPDFRVVDGDLIIATVPPAGVPLVQNDGFAHITVTDDQGTDTTDLDGDGVVDTADCTTGCETFGPELGALFYTDATLTLSPSTGLDGGESTIATLTGHRPNQAGWPFVQLNPLNNFLEDGPADPDSIPPGPPYGAPLAFVPTNGQGNASATLSVAASPTFNAKDQDYDADADCPVAQVTADHGLDRCIIGYTEFGMASMETHFSYSPDAPDIDPVPAAPTLTLTPNTGPEGTSVTVDGANWNAAPHFGSDTTIDDPGESALIIDVCNGALTSCAPAGTPDAVVAVTRYFDGGPDPDVQPVTPIYTGATLSGSFNAGTAGCAPACVVRVRQQRYNIEANAPVAGAFITATAPFSAGGGGGGGGGEPPPPPPPPPPPGAGIDGKTPAAMLTGSKLQKLGKTVRVRVFCPDEACRANAGGSVRVPRAGAAQAKLYKLKKATAVIVKGGRVTLRPKLPAAARTAIKRSLRRGRRITVRLRVIVADAAGNKRTLARQVRLRL